MTNYSKKHNEGDVKPKMMKNQKLVIALLVLTVLLSAIMCVVYILHDNKDEPKLDSLLTQTQAMNGVDKHIEFDFNSSHNVTQNNFRDFVDIKDIRGNSPEYVFVDKGDHFTIKAPSGGYQDGATYVVTLDNANFTDRSIDSDSPFYFSIIHDDVENVVYQSNVVQIANSDVIFFDGEVVTFKNNNIKVGDIVMFLFDNGEIKRDVSARIDVMTYSDGEYITANVSTPQEDEITAQQEIYGTYVPQITLEDMVQELDESELEAVLMQTPYIQAMSAVLAYDNIESKDIAISPKGIKTLIPKFDYKIEGGLNVLSGKSDPWKISFIFTWKDIKIQGVNVGDLKATISLTKDLKTVVNDIDGVKNTATISRTTWGFKLELDKTVFDTQDKYSSDYLKQNPNIKPNEYFKDVVDSDGKITDREAQYKNKDDERYSGGRPSNDVAQNVKEQNAAIDSRNDKRDNLNTLVENHKAMLEELNESKPAYRLLNFMVPIAPGVSFSFVLDLMFDIQFSGEFGVQYEKSFVEESGTIEYNGETQNYHNETEVLDAGNIFLSAYLEIKLGLRVQAGFTFVGVLTVGVQVEVGGYFEVRGVASWGWGNGINKEVYDGNPWSLTLETGIYLDIKVFAKFDIWIFEKTQVLPLCNYKFRLWSYGKDRDGAPNGVDNLTEDTEKLASIASEEREIMTVTIGEKGYAEMPTLYKSVYNMTSGEYHSFVIPKQDYIIGGEDWVFFQGNRIYPLDINVAEFEDLVYAFLIDENDKIDTNTFIPILIKKLPTKVESVTLSYSGEAITSNGSGILRVDVYPAEASYKQLEFTVDYIVHDGQKLTSNLNSYVQVDNQGVIYTQATMSYGDQIVVHARAITDGVDSNALEVTVGKTTVKEVRITTDGLRSDISPGGSILLIPFVNPTNADYDDIVLSIVSGNQYGYIASDGRTLVCYDTTAVNSEIVIVAIADEVVSEEYIFRVGAVPVESVVINDRTTFTELDKTTTVKLGATMELAARPYPSNTTEHRLYYSVTKNPNAVTIDNDGNLTITSDEEYAGQTVKIVANYGGVNSKEYEFKIDTIPVSQVILSTSSDKVEIGGSLQLNTQVLPSNATAFVVTYRLLQGGQYADIIDKGLLLVDNNAPIGLVISVQATVDGVDSNIVSVSITDIPIPIIPVDKVVFDSVTLISSGDESVSAIYRVIAYAYPTNATDIGLVFFVSVDYATIDDYGNLTILSWAPNNFSFIITAAANNGIFEAYELKQANSNSMEISRVSREGTDEVIDWDGSTNSDGSVNYSANKALPNDVLNLEASFYAIPTFAVYEIEPGNGYVVGQDKHSLTINALSYFNADIPSIIVTIRTLKNSTELKATVVIYIYLPVESLTMESNIQVDRGQVNDIVQYLIFNDKGYATNKDFVISGLSGKAIVVENTKILPDKDATYLTSFSFDISTYDKLFTGFSASIKLLDVNSLGGFTIEFGRDSNGYQVINQLENGSSVYVTPMIGSEVASLYGISITPNKTAGSADAFATKSVNDGVDKVLLSVYRYVGNSQANGEVSGRDNTFTFNVELFDGSQNLNLTITKTISIFKRLLSNASSKPINISITGQYTQLYLDNNDPLATFYETSDFNFTLYSNYTGYSISSTGYLTVDLSVEATDSPKIQVSCQQLYNGQVVADYKNGDIYRFEFDLERRFVSTVKHLNALNNNTSNYYLLRSISSIGTWTPISGFKGTLYGSGYSLSGLNIRIPTTNYSKEEYFGLFGNLEGSVENLNVNIDIRTSGGQHSGSHVYVGGIAGRLTGGKSIKNSTTSGYIDIDRLGSSIGGIAGYNAGTISGCSNAIPLYSVGDIGGVVGKNVGIVSSSSNSGRVSYYLGNSERSIGGIIGSNEKGTVSNCKNYGFIEARNTIDKKARFGTIIGDNAGTFDTSNTNYGGYDVTYTENILGLWTNGTYIFANYSQRVGRQQ